MNLTGNFIIKKTTCLFEFLLIIYYVSTILMVLNVYCRVKDDPVNFKILNNNVCNIMVPYKKKDFEFNINHIFQNVDNKAVFNKLIQNNSNQNYWVLFGFTGTGKTYTTNGILNELL